MCLPVFICVPVHTSPAEASEDLKHVWSVTVICHLGQKTGESVVDFETVGVCLLSSSQIKVFKVNDE